MIKNNLKIGVWMDHSSARLLQPGQTVQAIKIIKSGLINHPRTKGEKSLTSMFSSGSGKGFHFSNSEYNRNHIYRNKVLTYYKNLEKELAPYQEILLVGSSTAKEEFYNFIKNKKNFSKKNIFIQPAEYVTPKQFAALVKSQLEEREEPSLTGEPSVSLEKPNFIK